VTVPGNALVFDTGPLRHFSNQGWLGVLRFLAGSRQVYIPDSVERELMDAAREAPAVTAVIDADWITVHRTNNLEYVAAFSHYVDRLVVGGKNLGECGVLAMGQTYNCEDVIDDATARTIALEMGIQVTATVPLLCQAIRRKELTMVMVEELADNLLEGEYRLPFGPGGFRRHVIEHGLLDYDDI
jgi:predicted nucleic acid-binding protein